MHGRWAESPQADSSRRGGAQPVRSARAAGWPREVAQACVRTAHTHPPASACTHGKAGHAGALAKACAPGPMPGLPPPSPQLSEQPPCAGGPPAAISCPAGHMCRMSSRCAPLARRRLLHARRAAEVFAVSIRSQLKSRIQQRHAAAAAHQLDVLGAVGRVQRLARHHRRATAVHLQRAHCAGRPGGRLGAGAPGRVG